MVKSKIDELRPLEQEEPRRFKDSVLWAIAARIWPGWMQFDAISLTRGRWFKKPIKCDLSRVRGIWWMKPSFLQRLFDVRCLDVAEASGERRAVLVYRSSEDSAGQQLADAVMARVSTLIAEGQRPLEAVIASAKINLFGKAQYVRGSQVRRWQATIDLVTVDQAKQKLARLTNHPYASEAAKQRVTILCDHVGDLLSDRPERVRLGNWAHMELEASDEAKTKFFSSVESSPLTPQQVRAALAMDDVNMAVAAAGSGKTSVIVAKAGYALLSKYCDKDSQVLGVTFNSGAAKELRHRLVRRLSEFFMRPVRVKARTLHSLGLSFIPKPEDGRKWRIVKLEDDPNDAMAVEGKRFFTSAVNELRKNNRAFQEAVFNWQLYAQYPDPAIEGESVDFETCARRYEDACWKQLRLKIENKAQFGPTIPTYDLTQPVRSLEERAIYNWLYARGVDFKYEKEESFDVRVARFGPTPEGQKFPKSYKPDFSYAPAVEGHARIRHEHFGIDKNNKAQDFMGGDAYVKEAEEKRRAYKTAFADSVKKGRTLPFFETTSAQFRDGTVFSVIESELGKRGIKVGPIKQEIIDQALAGC